MTNDEVDYQRAVGWMDGFRVGCITGFSGAMLIVLVGNMVTR